MEKREEEKDNNQKFNDNNPDPTKVAFFSDMGNMEEEIASEAIELVTHALSLIEARFYDDSIEILRQAIGLYDQINKIAEVNALNNKISEIYLLKEQSFRESELERDTIIQDSQEALLEQTEEELYSQADSLIIEALQLVTNERFDDALDKYDEATKILQKLSKELELTKLSDLIEDCFNKKAEFVQIHKKASTGEIITLEQENEGTLSELEIKAQRIRAFEEFKRKENQISNQAYELIGNATELKKRRQYDEAIRLYDEGLALFQEINWNNEVKKIKNMIEQVEREKKRFLEEFQKIKVEEERAEEFKKQKEAALIDSAQLQEQIKGQAQAEKLRVQSERKQEEATFQNEIAEMVDYAEKLARDYDLKVKSAIRKGKLLEECVFPVVIKIYEEVRTKVKERGWKDQTELYANQIRHYHALLEKDKNLRQIEIQKRQKQKEYDEALKIKTDSTIVEVDVAQKKGFEEQRKKEAEAKNFREMIDNLVKRAEKIGREYNIAFKKAVKEGNMNIESKYPKIIKIYTKARDSVLEKGWNEDAAILSGHIRKYSELLEKEKRIREIEAKKDEEKKSYEEFHKIQKKEIDVEKIKEIETKKSKKLEEQHFQKEITGIVDKAEKLAREYEIAKKSAIKKGKDLGEVPYFEIIEIYTKLRNKVLTRGWTDQALIYAKQIKIYQEKLESDKRLRELEAKKKEKQKDFEDSLKITKEVKKLKLQEIQAINSKDRETDGLLNEAMALINEVENEVRSYELSLKKDLLYYDSPYEKAISNYEKARKLFQKIGWKEEAHRLISTITFYKEKKVKDNNLRLLEQQKLETSKEKLKYKPKEEVFAHEKKIIEFEKIKEATTKGSEEIFNIINRAERMAQEYEIKKKKGILNIKSPYEEIINMYMMAKKEFEKIGWNEQANQIINPMRYYQEKSKADKRLRALETEKISKEEEEINKRKIETVLAREAEVELLKQKTQALELKKKHALEYESKKEQAFNFMDLAKKEFKQKSFEKAIKFYKESEKIFAEIKWSEGQKMIKESIKVIKLKKERIEQEQKVAERQEAERLKLEAQIEDEIIKAKDLQKLQQDQKRREFLAIQKEKEREKEISENAYHFLEEGTKLKNKKKFEEAFEKYIMGRDLFKQIGWQHEVSRINNDLLFILKKEMKQTEKIKARQQKKVEDKKELEGLLKEAEKKRKELDDIKKEEKRKRREDIVQKELEIANDIIKDLKYNEGILKLKNVIKKLEKLKQDKLVKQMNKQIEVLENASQVPIITTSELERDENINKFELAYRALDKAQISLSNNLFMKAITQLNEAMFNLKETKIGIKYISLIESKVNSYKKELDIKTVQEQKVEVPKVEKDDIRVKIAARRAERRKKIKELMSK